MKYELDKIKEGDKVTFDDKVPILGKFIYELKDGKFYNMGRKKGGKKPVKK